MKAVYPGSFDPITLGHVDIIRRVSKMFAQVTVLVARAENKQYLFNPDERKKMIMETVSDLSNVTVEVWDGLTVDYVKKTGSQVIVRGLRGFSDFDNEWAIAHTNVQLYEKAETIFVLSSLENSHIASRIVKEVAKNKGPLDKFVPVSVIPFLKKKFGG